MVRLFVRNTEWGLGKGGEWMVSLFKPAASFTLLENMKIRCNIQVISYPFLYMYNVYIVHPGKQIVLYLGHFFSTMASKPIYIRWIRTGSEPYRKIMFIIILQTINTSLVSYCLWPLASNKISFNLITFHFNTRGKLSIIRCDK